MKKIVLIRHGESEMNAGKIILDNQLIKLTENGKKQAEDLVDILAKPDKIVVSKFVRTLETAYPLMKKYQDIETHVWLDVHEFNYLSREDFLDKEKSEFDKHAQKYWRIADPEYRDREHLETFHEFVDRIHNSIKKMNSQTGVNYIFTHGQYIACFGYIIRNYTKESFESKMSEVEFYKSIMDGLNESYFKGDYLAAKNTEIIDVTEWVEKYCR